MDSDSFAKLISLVTPDFRDAVFAVLGSLLTLWLGPWFKWKIEQRRERSRERRALIASAREKFFTCPSRQELVKLPEYARLRKFIAPRIVAELESDDIVILDGGPRYSGVEPCQVDVLDDLSRIEREWGLI